LHCAGNYLIKEVTVCGKERVYRSASRPELACASTPEWF
jgi:hypothetical protein